MYQSFLDDTTTTKETTKENEEEVEDDEEDGHDYYHWKRIGSVVVFGTIKLVHVAAYPSRCFW